MIFCQILRLWSAESCKFMNEYNVPNSKTLVDFDFDENKVITVGVLPVSVIWVSHAVVFVFDCKIQRYLCITYLYVAIFICSSKRTNSITRKLGEFVFHLLQHTIQTFILLMEDVLNTDVFIEIALFQNFQPYHVFSNKVLTPYLHTRNLI